MNKGVLNGEYSDGFAYGYKRGRADAERDFQNSDYWNDYLAEIKKQTRAAAIDEFARVYEQINLIGCSGCRHFNDDVRCLDCVVEQLKEKKNV